MRAAAADLMMCDPDLSLIRSLTSPRPFEKIRIRGSCFLRVRKKNVMPRITQG